MNVKTDGKIPEHNYNLGVYNQSTARTRYKTTAKHIDWRTAEFTCHSPVSFLWTDGTPGLCFFHSTLFAHVFLLFKDFKI
jgi:hypothetical protein